MASNDAVQASALPTFHSVFGPIAYHLFPDGCPLPGGSGGLSEGTRESHFLKEAWPIHTQRSIVSSATATQSLAELRRYTQKNGLTAAELVAVAFLATQFIVHRRGISSSSTATTVHSPLLDPPKQATKHFFSIMRCLLPQCVAFEEEAEATAMSDALRVVVHRLCTVVSFRSSSNSHHGKDIRSSSKQEEEELLLVPARQCVIRFISLLVLYVPVYDSIPHTTTLAYTMKWLVDPSTCLDAVRLLWYLYHHHYTQFTLPPYRWQQIRTFYHQTLAGGGGEPEDKSPSSSILSAAAWSATRTAVADFLQRSEANSVGALRSTTSLHRWTLFPDAAWENDFIQIVSIRAPEILPRKHVGGEAKEDIICIPPPKRFRYSSSRRDLHSIRNYLRNPYPGGESAIECPINGWIRWVSTADASTILQDCGFQHGFSLDDPSHPSHLQWRRMMAMLVHKLYEQWNHAPSDGGLDANSHNPSIGIDKSCHLLRRTLLRAILEFVQVTQQLPEEMERFIFENVVPQGHVATDDDDEEYTLLHILTYIRPPRHESVLDEESSSVTNRISLGRNILRMSPLFGTLEKWFWRGTDGFRCALVSITLTKLMCRWMAVDWSTVSDAGMSVEMDHGIVEKWKMQILQKLCQWVDDLLLKGFVASHKEGSELLQSAAVDFYLSIGELVATQDSPSILENGVFLGPSSSLLYRVFLSSSAIHLDRACSLLVVYKDVFQKWKSLYVEVDNRKKYPSMDDDTWSAGLARIQSFNDTIYDFCSMLWTCSSFPNPPISMEERVEAQKSSILFQDLRPLTRRSLHAIATSESTKHPGSTSSISSALSITHGAVFVGYVSDFLKMYFEATTPKFSPDVIQGKIKVHYLEYLKLRGLSGIYKFLHTFVRSLAPRTQE